MTMVEQRDAWRYHCDQAHQADGAYRDNVKRWHQRNAPDCAWTPDLIVHGPTGDTHALTVDADGVMHVDGYTVGEPAVPALSVSRLRIVAEALRTTAVELGRAEHPIARHLDGWADALDRLRPLPSGDGWKIIGFTLHGDGLASVVIDQAGTQVEWRGAPVDMLKALAELADERSRP